MNDMKKIILLLPLLLAGCNSFDEPLLISQQQVAIVPPEELYRCPQFHLPSNPNNLKDSDVAKIIAAQHQNLKVCRNSLNAIKQYSDEAKQITEQKKNWWE